MFQRRPLWNDAYVKTELVSASGELQAELECGDPEMTRHRCMFAKYFSQEAPLCDGTR